MIVFLIIFGYITGYVVCLFLLHSFGVKIGMTDFDNYKGYCPDFKSNASYYATFSMLSWMGVVIFIITIIILGFSNFFSKLGKFLIDFSLKIQKIVNGGKEIRR